MHDLYCIYCICVSFTESDRIHANDINRVHSQIPEAGLQRNLIKIRIYQRIVSFLSTAPHYLTTRRLTLTVILLK